MKKLSSRKIHAYNLRFEKPRQQVSLYQQVIVRSEGLRMAHNEEDSSQSWGTFRIQVFGKVFLLLYLVWFCNFGKR